jgi:hypothetical protein
MNRRNFFSTVVAGFFGSRSIQEPELPLVPFTIYELKPEDRVLVVPNCEKKRRLV